MKDNQSNQVSITPPVPAMSESGAVEAARAATEVQSAVVMAKQFPRDEEAAYNHIMKACKRGGLAEKAMYAYPKGNTTVTGPSIRLTEEIIRCWGNMQCGFIILNQNNIKGESDVMAYAWDIESNTRFTRTFKVEHKLKAHGKYKNLTDPRDIYELTANQAMRRLRACMMEVIPSDILEDAVEACKATLANPGKNANIHDRARKMIVLFDQRGVTKDMIEGRLGKKIEAITPEEVAEMLTIYNSLSDNTAGVSDFFDVPKPDKKMKSSDLNEQMDKELEKKADAKKKDKDSKEEKNDGSV